VLGLALAFLKPLAAQGVAGTITGTVTDSASGAAVESAVILVKGTLLRAATNGRGEFRLFPVPSGVQTLTVAAAGYRAASTVVQVPPDGTVEADIPLAVALVELPGIVVTANRGEEEQRDSPASVAVITQRELVDRNITTIDEALPFVPGITFNHDDITIRGSTGIANGVGSRVLLLLDGHPVLTGDGGEVDFETIPLLDLERVEVVKGAYSSLYGSNALGGVVNLITSPVSDKPATLLRAHVGIYQVPDRYKFTNDQLTTQGLGLQHSRRMGDVGVRFFAGRETTDGYTDNGYSGRWLLRTKVTSASGAAHPWDVYAIYANEVDYSFFSWRSQGHPFEVNPSFKGDNERANKLLLGGSITPVVRARTLLRISPYANYNTLRNDFQANNDHHNAFKVGGTTQLVVTTGAAQSLTLGADGGYTRVTSNFLGDRGLDDGGLFGQYDARLAAPLRIVGGARVDYHKSTSSESEVSLSPKLGVAVRASDQISLRASVGRGYRAPSAIEQFVNTTQFNFRVVPNPALKGERAWAGELGLTATRGRFWLDASVFQSDYRNLIAPGPVPGQPGEFQFQNLERARIQGLDAGFRMRLIQKMLDVQACYLFLNTRDLNQDAPLPYRSKHTVTGTVDAIGGLLGMDVQFRSKPDTVLVYPLDPRKAITLLDLRLAYRVLGTGLQLKVTNLLQSRYTNIQERTPGAPRNISLTAYRGF
jgi:outer membrane cobalamin receptor